MKTIKYYMILWSCFILIGCQSNNPSNQKEAPVDYNELDKVKQNEVIQFINKLKVISLPYSAYCSGDYKPDTSISYSETRKLFDGYGSVIGRLPSQSNFETIVLFAVGDDAYLVLKTFDKAGNSIADYQLVNYCLGEQDYDKVGSFTIDKNLFILKVDSTWFWEVDSLDYEIQGTRKLSIEIDTVKILETGQFSEI